MAMKKIRAFLGIAVISFIYGFISHWIGTQEGFWKMPALFVVSLFFITGIWICLDIMFGKHESKDGGHDC